MNNPSTGTPVLKVHAVNKSFKDAGHDTRVLHQVSLELERGETLAIVGSSGSGKSTLLHIIGGLDTPSSGEVEVKGLMLSKLSDGERGKVRNKHLGFIYQFHHLLPEFTALENVSMPLMIRGEPLAKVRDEAKHLLARVGLEHRIGHKPGQMSGGERQRCAVARALITRPACVLGDEPTGNLDAKNAHQVYELMLELNREIGTSFILVTHDNELAAKMDRTLHLEDGRLRS